MGAHFHKVIGLKVDVDTHKGMKEGVPVLLALLKRYGIPASFFVPMGKDHTGWTAKRVFTRKGFLKKANRVGVLETYGMKTLMYGLLLPGPEIARQNLFILQRITAEGHEVGIHGLDHVDWHDHVKGWSREKTEAVLQKACIVYEQMLSVEPRSFAAPGWMINKHALRFFNDRVFSYSSDTRGVSPFFPTMGGLTFDVLQIPTTLPTLDEVVGIVGTETSVLTDFFLDSLHDGLNIITVHAELEGNRWSAFLETFVRATLDRGFEYKKLCHIAEECREDAPAVSRCKIVYGCTEGRAGEVCRQNL